MPSIPGDNEHVQIDIYPMTEHHHHHHHGTLPQSSSSPSSPSSLSTASTPKSTVRTTSAHGPTSPTTTTSSAINHIQPQQQHSSELSHPHSNGFAHGFNANATSTQHQFKHHNQKSHRRLSASVPSSPISPGTANSNNSIVSTLSSAPTSPTSESRSGHQEPGSISRGQGINKSHAMTFDHHDHFHEGESTTRVTTAFGANGFASANSSASSGKRSSMLKKSRPRSKSHPDQFLPTGSGTGFRSATFGCSWSMLILFLVSAGILVCILHSHLYHQIDTKGCDQTYMIAHHPKMEGFNRELTPFAGKYSLHLYRDLPVETDLNPQGIPVLFIPGNAGSMRQMRSIGTMASRYYYKNIAQGYEQGKTWLRPLDFYSVDLNEEFSALHGHSLLEQARYLNDAVKYILDHYRQQPRLDPSIPYPTSVVILGHSMGGVVARTMFTMDNYVPGSINTIVTLATPHMMPPVTLDFEISNIYNKINHFWSTGFQGPDAPLRNVSLVSIAGGNLDIIVNGDWANVHSIVPLDHGFTVFTSSIPRAWVGSDHLSIMWCNQAAAVISKVLVDVTDARNPEKTKPLEERMRLFRNTLLTGVDDHSDQPAYPKGIEVIQLSTTSHTLIPEEETFSYPSNPRSEQETGGKHRLFVMTIPRDKPDSVFSLLSDHPLGQQSRLDVLLCNDLGRGASKLPPSSTLGSLPTQLSCHYNVLSPSPVPASTQHIALPSYKHEFKYISKTVAELERYQYVVIVDRGLAMGTSGFLLAEFKTRQESSIVIETSTLGLINKGVRLYGFPEMPALVSTIHLPNIDNSLLAYNLKVDRPGCHNTEQQRFTPMLRQSSWSVYEDKYAVNITGHINGLNISFHGDLPYFDRVRLPGRQGIDLTFWMDPTCPVPLSINLQLDLYGSLGKIVTRYRMAILVFSFLVVLVTLRAQFQRWNGAAVGPSTGTGGSVALEPFVPFGVMMSRLINTTYVKFSIMLAVVALIQSLQTRVVRDLVGGVNGTNSMSDTSSTSASIPASSMLNSGSYVATSPSSWSLFKAGDVLLGTNDSFFWFLAPVFFQISIGLVTLIWVLLNGFVRLAASMLLLLHRGGSPVLASTTSSAALGGGVNGGVSGSANGGSYFPNRSSRGLKRRAITTVVLFVMVATFVPFQFAFIVAVLVHIVACVRALIVAQRTSPVNSVASMAAWDRYHYLMSIFVLLFLLLPCTLPVLMVWIRNLSVQWYEPFSSDHRLDYIAPFIFFVEAVTSGAMIPRASQKIHASVTNWILNGMIVYLILYGVRYSWVIFFLSDIFIAWLLFLQVKDTAVYLRIVKYVLLQTEALMGPTKKRN